MSNEIFYCNGVYPCRYDSQDSTSDEIFGRPCGLRCSYVIVKRSSCSNVHHRFIARVTTDGDEIRVLTCQRLINAQVFDTFATACSVKAFLGHSYEIQKVCPSHVYFSIKSGL